MTNEACLMVSDLKEPNVPPADIPAGLKTHVQKNKTITPFKKTKWPKRELKRKPADQ